MQKDADPIFEALYGVCNACLLCCCKTNALVHMFSRFVTLICCTCRPVNVDYSYDEFYAQLSTIVAGYPQIVQSEVKSYAANVCSFFGIAPVGSKVCWL